MLGTTKKTSRVNFTKDAILRIRAPERGRFYIYDSKQPGLCVCVTSTGTRTFYVYRKIDRKPERTRLGTFPEITVDEARRRTRSHIGAIADGTNPATKGRIRRNAPTLREVFDAFIQAPTKTRAKRPKSPSTIRLYNVLMLDSLASWSDRRLSDISRHDVEALHARIGNDHGTYLANRALSLLKTIFNHAIDDGLFNGNPAARVRGFEEESRQRFLQAGELPRFWAALEVEPSESIRDFVLLALFTGQRRGNVLAMRWEDVTLDGDRPVWCIPKTKSGRHEVPLLPEAVEVLRRRLAHRLDSPYVLPGMGGRSHLKDPSVSWRKLLKRAGITDLRLHDLRRSLASWQVTTGATLAVVGKTLGHTSSRSTGVYARLSDAPVRKAMGTAVAAMLAAAKPKPRQKAR